MSFNFPGVNRSQNSPMTQSKFLAPGDNLHFSPASLGSTRHKHTQTYADRQSQHSLNEAVWLYGTSGNSLQQGV